MLFNTNIHNCNNIIGQKKMEKHNSSAKVKMHIFYDPGSGCLTCLSSNYIQST